MISHAANPVAKHLYADVFRVYFSCRDKERRFHIGYVDVDIRRPVKVLAISETPLLAPGEIGTFNDSGVSLACINPVKGQKFLYYVGWNLGVTVPWCNSIGLAIYNETTHQFERYSQAPIIERHHVDPYSLSYPFVLEDNGLYQMWYGSNLSWGPIVEDMTLLIKYAESDDAINWRREGRIALSFKDTSEYALAMPFVLKEKERYKMWYSYRARNIVLATPSRQMAWFGSAKISRLGLMSLSQAGILK